MEIKKYPNAILDNYSSILTQLGLVLSLFIVYQFINMKSYPTTVKDIQGVYVPITDSEKTIEVKIIEPVAENISQSVVPEKILRVEDEVDIKETVIESTETDEFQAVKIDPNKDLINVEKDEETVVEDVPFLVIENVPIFPGCAGDNTALRECFSEEISKFVAKKFNTDLASDLGLTPGSIQKIFVMFKIDKNGDISDIQARAPHKKLQDEAIRVIELLPKMTPGKQRGKPVGVKYGLPIVFKVQ